MKDVSFLNKIENSKPIDFGIIFNKSIELFKKIWIQGFVHLLLSSILITVLIFVMYIPIIAVVGISELDNGLESYAVGGDEFSVVFLLLFILLVFTICIAMITVQFAISAHFFKTCKQIDYGIPEDSSYFMFLNKKYLKKIILLSLAMIAIGFGALLLCYIPLFYAMVPLQLVVVIFAFNPEMEVSDLIKSSFTLGNKVWLTTFGLIMISSFLAQFIGMFLCFIGIFFTASFAKIPLYYIYKDAIGFDENATLKNDTDISLIEE